MGGEPKGRGRHQAPCPFEFPPLKSTSLEFHPSNSSVSAPPPSPELPFPPQDLDAFLALCEGEWLALRSLFSLAETLEDGAGDDAWHRSERSELSVRYQRGPTADGAGLLEVQPAGSAPRQLAFHPNGTFRVGEQAGRWQLWPDGSLELVIDDPTVLVRERIWFTKPNLRLRSCVERRGDGPPDRASFSSEIRRMTLPS